MTAADSLASAVRQAACGEELLDPLVRDKMCTSKPASRRLASVP